MHIKSTLFLVLLFSFISCSQDQLSSNATRHTAGKSKAMGAQSDKEALHLEEQIETEPPRSGQPPSPPEPEVDKASKIIKNGNMSFEVVNLKDSKTRVDSILSSLDAYYENETYHSSTYSSSYDLKIRIPAARFEHLITLLESGIGKLTVKNLSANDVTARYIDLKIKIDNNLAYLKRYNQLLSKANSIEDMMEIQDKTRALEAQINSQKGSLKYLNDRASYSSLNLTLLAKTERIIHKDHFGDEIVESIKVGLNGFKYFLLGLIRLWPFILLGCILYVFRHRFRWPFRRTKKKDYLEPPSKE